LTALSMSLYSEAVALVVGPLSSKDRQTGNPVKIRNGPAAVMSVKGDPILEPLPIPAGIGEKAGRLLLRVRRPTNAWSKSPARDGDLVVIQ
jgi:hypothetical protein